MHHFSRPGPDTDFRMEYIQPILSSDSPIIFDRSYVSELVYGNIFRGGSGITPDIKAYVEGFLRANNCILVYLKRGDYKWIDREEMYTENDNLKIMEEYDRIYPMLDIPKIQTDSFDPNSIEIIMNFYRENNPEYVG